MFLLSTSPLPLLSEGERGWSRQGSFASAIATPYVFVVIRAPRTFEEQPILAAEPHPGVRTARRLDRRRHEPSIREITPPDSSHTPPIPRLERPVGRPHLWLLSSVPTNALRGSLELSGKGTSDARPRE
ncbi:hypothetical protein QCA50_010201 [Cerrena zonata]|uniref:Uncharacterized protein n=1 Tax=Cerrena zonata TaxID=2478898 RepID=A0AAW0G013_9APHY